MNYKPFQKSPIPINLFISHNLKIAIRDLSKLVYKNLILFISLTIFYI